MFHKFLNRKQETLEVKTIAWKRFVKSYRLFNQLISQLFPITNNFMTKHTNNKGKFNFPDMHQLSRIT